MRASSCLRQAPIGVIWPNDRRIAELAPVSRLDRAGGAGVPDLPDGRAYSQARLLRERHEFRGELRATGQVLRDQLLFLHRAGFDAFEVTKENDAAAFAEALQRYSVFYQPTGDGRPSALRARLRPGYHRRRPGAAGVRPVTAVLAFRQSVYLARCRMSPAEPPGAATARSAVTLGMAPSLARPIRPRPLRDPRYPLCRRRWRAARL